MTFYKILLKKKQSFLKTEVFITVTFNDYLEVFFFLRNIQFVLRKNKTT